MDLRDIFEQHCDWIQPGTTVLRKGDPQENISARKDLLTKFNGCSSDICINEGEKKKDPSLMEKEYPWVVKDEHRSDSSSLGPSPSVLAFSSPGRHPVDAAIQTNSKIIKEQSMNEKLLYDRPSKCPFRSSKDVERRQGN
ncbi:uncharacterized protein LOC129634267 isoform X8 [Bubalus kerabau]|uniref:uncharacterized protein LOC129634267 isoform X8 n=1 Tax=Bubalus carabanensis TaxID=3119969 RepID=UPI00244EFF6D|nr:uncharacterized protein LOC129634267 isoform X8 [Bubalus carabanensis]